MSKKSAKPSKKKDTVSNTSRAKSTTRSKPSTSQTYNWQMVDMWNSRDTSLGTIGGSWSACYDLTPDSTSTFYFTGITPSGKEVNYTIQIGPKGLEYSTQLDGEFRKIG